MVKRLRAWLLVLCAFALQAGAVTVLDDRQQAVEVVRSPRRVVSLLPSLTETVCALGACDRLVGVDRYSNWPTAVQALPRLGGGLDPNIEAIVAAQPDLVLLAGSTRGLERLQALGLTVLPLEPRTHADTQRVLHAVAAALGVPRAESERVWREMDTGVQAAAKMLTPAARAQRVYVEVSPAPYGASESSFIGQTLSRLGVGNILPASMGPFPKVNPEMVVRAQPDAIMIGDSALASMAQRPGWAQMRAMRDGRICAFSSDQSDVLVRAGPRMAEGARLMAQCLNRTAARPSKGPP